MSEPILQATYPRQCWHNRNVIDSLAPYTSHDEECTEPITAIVLVPTYGDIKGAGEFWPTLTCDGHAPELMHELTCEGYERDELITATIDTPKEEVPCTHT